MILQDMFVGKVAWNNHSEFTSPTTNLWKSHLKSLDFSKYSLVLKVQERCFNLYLGVGLKYFYFHPSLGKIPTLTNIFQMGWLNHQPDKISLHKKNGKKKTTLNTIVLFALNSSPPQQGLGPTFWILPLSLVGWRRPAFGRFATWGLWRGRAKEMVLEMALKASRRMTIGNWSACKMHWVQFWSHIIHTTSYNQLESKDVQMFVTSNTV